MGDLISAFGTAVNGILRLDATTIVMRFRRRLRPDRRGLDSSTRLVVRRPRQQPAAVHPPDRPARLIASLGVEAVLSVVRLAIWLGSFWILLQVLSQRPVTLATVVLVVGLGYAPMLFSILVIIPSVGPLIGRVLYAWTLVTILASIAVATRANPLDMSAGGIAAVLLILLVRRWSDRVSVLLLSRVSRLLVGVDVMQRTRALDPEMVMAGRSG